MCVSQNQGPFIVSANIMAWGAIGLLGLVSEKKGIFGKLESTMALTLVLRR